MIVTGSIRVRLRFGSTTLPQTDRNRSYKTISRHIH